MEKTSEDQNNEGEIVDAILNGKKITKLAAETGLDVDYIHKILINRNIYYEDVLEKRRSERIKKQSTEMGFELKVNPAETLYVPAQKRKKDVNEIEMEYAILKEVENDEKLLDISRKYRISINKIIRILFDHGIKYSDLRLKKKMEKLEILYKTKSQTITANARLTGADLPPLHKAVLFDIIRIANKIQRQPKLGDIIQYGHFLPADIRSITGSYTMCCKLLHFNAFGKTRFMLSMSEAEFDDILKNYLEQTSQIKADVELEEKNYVIMKKQVKEEKKILYLKKLAEELGRPPMKRDLIQRKVYMSYYNFFGSLSTALEKAGLQKLSEVKRIEKENMQRLNKELKPSYIEKARELNNRLGRTPLPQELSPETDFKNSKYAEIFGSYTALCKAAGFIVPFRYKGSYRSDEYLFEVLRKIAAKIGHAPTLAEFEKHAAFSFMVLVRRFGNYGNSLKLAGLEIRPRFHYTNEELLNMLRQIAEKKNRRPCIDDLKEAGVASYSTFRENFGGFNNALELSGIDISAPRNTGKSRKKQYTEEMLISWLKDFAVTHNRNPHFIDFKSPSYVTFRKYFGTMKAAFSKAGLTGKHEFTAEALIQRLKLLTPDQLMHLHSIDLKGLGLPDKSVLVKTFGSLEASRQAAGFDKKFYMKQELLSNIKQFYLIHNRAPMSKDFGHHNLPSMAVVYNLFENLPDALTAAGINVSKYRNSQISDTELINRLKKFAIENKRAPKYEDFKNGILPAYSTYYLRFGSFKNILSRAGIDNLK